MRCWDRNVTGSMPYRESNHCRTPTMNAIQYTITTIVTALFQSSRFKRNAISNDARHARPETSANMVWNTYILWNPTVSHPKNDTATSRGRNRKNPRCWRMERRKRRRLHRTYSVKNTGAIGVQYGMMTPSLVPSTGKVINAITSNTSLAFRIRPLFPCAIYLMSPLYNPLRG